MAEKLYRCWICNTLKEPSEFWKDKSRSPGLSSACKECKARRYRERYYPQLKESQRYQQRHRESQRQYVTNHPEVQRAHGMAQNHRAAIKKPACERCGVTSRTLQMHHPDYAKPLEVVTLCVPCHETTHHAEV